MLFRSSAALLGQLSLQGTLAKAHQGAQGARPQQQIEKILDHLGFKGDYYVKAAESGSKFHALRKPQFTVVIQSNSDKKKYMDKIPWWLMADSRFRLMCASITIGNSMAEKTEQHRFHAVAGYVCEGQGYVYDSNQRKVWKCD